MKKLISTLLAIQLLLVLTGCCPCGKKAPDKDTQPQQAPEKK